MSKRCCSEKQLDGKKTGRFDDLYADTLEVDSATVTDLNVTTLGFEDGTVSAPSIHAGDLDTGVNFDGTTSQLVSDGVARVSATTTGVSLTGQTTVPSGNVSSPSVVSDAAPSSGLYWVGSDVHVSNAGVQRFKFDNSRNENNGPLDIITESQNALRIFKDTSNIAVIIAAGSGGGDINYLQLYANGDAHNVIAINNTGDGGGGGDGYPRWGIQLTGAETGSNEGSNFRINTYTDAGSYAGSPFRIYRDFSRTEIGTPVHFTASGIPATLTDRIYRNGTDLFWSGVKLNNNDILTSAAVGTLDETHDVVRSTAAQTITLPLAASSPGRVYTIMNTALHTTTIQTTNPDIFDDATATTDISTQYEHVTVKSDGVQVWMVL